MTKPWGPRFPAAFPGAEQASSLQTGSGFLPQKIGHPWFIWWSLFQVGTLLGGFKRNPKGNPKKPFWEGSPIL